MEKINLINLITKDVELLNEHLDIINKLKKTTLDQFLYISTSKWSGDIREVEKFLNDMIKFLIESIILIKNSKNIEDPIEFMFNFYKKTFSEDKDILLFFNGIKQTCIGCDINYSVFPNLMKMEQENSEC